MSVTVKKFVRLKTIDYATWIATKSDEEKAAYASSLIFDETDHLLYAQGVAYGVGDKKIKSVEDAVSALYAVKSITGDTGSTFTAASGKESISIKGAEDSIISTDVDSEGNITISADVSGKTLIVDDTESSSDYAKVYKFYQGTQDSDHLITTVNIPKDMVVSSGTVVTKTEAGDWGDAGTYIELTIANTTSDKLYIKVSDLIEYVTSGSASGDTVVISVSEDHKVTATITDGTITKGKLDSDVQASLEAADSAIQEVEAGTYVTVSEKSNNKQTINVTIQDIVTATIGNGTPGDADYVAPAMGLAEASDVKIYVDAVVSGKNVSAEGESDDSALVSASASDNNVTVSSTDKLKEAVSLAESALQSVSTSSDYITVGKKDDYNNQSIDITTSTLDAYDAVAKVEDATDEQKAAVDGLATVGDVYEKIVENEKTTANSLTDLDTRLKLLEEWEEID